MGTKVVNLNNLLFKTLSVIKSNDKLRFFNLILLLLLQSILDVISIASLIPILYIFQSDMEIKVNNFLMKYGFGEIFADKSTYFYTFNCNINNDNFNLNQAFYTL